MWTVFPVEETESCLIKKVGVFSRILNIIQKVASLMKLGTVGSISS